MPVYDYLCPNGHIKEEIAGTNETTRPCGICGKEAHRIISASGAYCANEEAGWLKTVVDIVDTSSTAKPEAVEFRRNPTRSNWKAWMKAEKIRPLEPGEHHHNPVSREINVDKLCEMHMKRMAIEVRST